LGLLISSIREQVLSYILPEINVPKAFKKKKKYPHHKTYILKKKCPEANLVGNITIQERVNFKRLFSLEGMLLYIN
jgi:hypothetical protein